MGSIVQLTAVLHFGLELGSEQSFESRLQNSSDLQFHANACFGLHVEIGQVEPLAFKNEYTDRDKAPNIGGGERGIRTLDTR